MWPNHTKPETKNDTISNYYKNKFLVVQKLEARERLEAENTEHRTEHEQNLSAYFLIEHIIRNWEKCILRSRQMSKRYTSTSVNHKTLQPVLLSISHYIISAEPFHFQKYQP